MDEATQSRIEQTEAAGERTRAARRLLRGPVMNGVPAEFRPFVWPLLCGVAKARAAKGEHVFPALLQRSEGRDRNQELELDLDRTFPGHPLLDKESAHGAEGIAALHRVLNSYALYNPAVGYCQSMNFIVGILLIMDVREEDAFWIISHISDSLLPNHFAPPMLGAQVDNKLFSQLLRKHLPRLAAHLDTLGMDPGMVCGQWFLCIFCNRMPCETVARVWDAVFCKGPQTIFQVALAIFKLCEDKLMACDDMGRAIQLLREFEASLYDADALLECTMLHFQAVGDVGRMREELLPSVRREYQEYRRRMDAYRMQASAPPRPCYSHRLQLPMNYKQAVLLRVDRLTRAAVQTLQESVRKGKDLVKDLGKDLGGRLSLFGQALGSFGAEAKAKASDLQQSGLMRDAASAAGTVAQQARAAGKSSWLSSAKSSLFSMTGSARGDGVPLKTDASEGGEMPNGARAAEQDGSTTASGDFWGESAARGSFRGSFRHPCRTG